MTKTINPAVTAAIADGETITEILLAAYRNATIAGASSEHFIVDLLNDLAEAGFSIGRYP